MALTVGMAYLVVLGTLGLFGAHRLHLLWVLWRTPHDDTPPEDPISWPPVTVQLPVYNEATVVGRLIDAVACLDYPRDRLQVQVLDDSSDETVEIVAELVRGHHAKGLDIEHVRRPLREGFKAGALAYGLQSASGEFVAIFDADFVPAPDFLRRTIPWFCDPTLGLVQGRWEHLNRQDGLLTRVQALALDAHFLVEQAARSRSGRFFNFNGTAGVFRREAIDAAGGWSSDTITEDLDLSFRAQLCGWRFRFLEGVAVPAELPRNLDAFRAQQRRWTRGSAQTARKLLGLVWSTPEVRLKARLEATFQLLLNAAYPLMFLLALLTVPLAVIGYPRTGYLIELQWLFFSFATVAVALFYLASQRRRGGRGMAQAVVEIPFLFACGLGLSLSNGWAWLAGLVGGPVPFERTPKEGAGGSSKRYRARASWVPLVGEGAMTVYMAAGAALALELGRFTALPFLLLIGAGFGVLASESLKLRLGAAGRGLPQPTPSETEFPLAKFEAGIPDEPVLHVSQRGTEVDQLRELC